MHQHGLTSLVNKDILFELYSFSFASFKNRIEYLNETSTNINTLEGKKSYNINCFNYLGYKLLNDDVIFSLIDYQNIALNDVHIMPVNQAKLGLGFKKVFSHLLIISFQLEEYLNITRNGINLSHQKSEFKIQVAYGF